MAAPRPTPDPPGAGVRQVETRIAGGPSGSEPASRAAASPGMAAVRRLVEAMPKAELHLHLDGSLRVDTALDLARSRGIEAPRTYAGMFDALVAPERTSSQAELIAAFDLPIALLQDA